jgi:hypothetical protein
MSGRLAISPGLAEIAAVVEDANLVVGVDTASGQDITVTTAVNVREEKSGDIE